MDNTGEHGWAAQLTDQATNIKWSVSHNDITSLSNYTNARNAISDLGGHANTAQIRAYGTANAFPAAYVADFANGWYLPSIGQLRILFSELVSTNTSLSIAGGSQIPMDSNWWYWSSTEYNANNAWTVNYYGFTNYFDKSTQDYSSRVRCVRDF